MKKKEEIILTKEQEAQVDDFYDDKGVTAIKELVARQIDELPKYEKTLSIGPWLLSPASPFRLIQAINAFSAQAWFYQQIKKMGKGLMPDLSLKPWKAFRDDAKADQEAVKEYQNF